VGRGRKLNSRKRRLSGPLPLTAASASFNLTSRGDTREKALLCLGGDSEVLQGDAGGWEGGGL